MGRAVGPRWIFYNTIRLHAPAFALAKRRVDRYSVAMPYADPEKRREWARIRNARRYREDPEFRAQQHRYYLANKGKWAAHRLMHMYGINPNQMVKLFLKQQQACG